MASVWRMVLVLAAASVAACSSNGLSATIEPLDAVIARSFVADLYQLDSDRSAGNGDACANDTILIASDIARLLPDAGAVARARIPALPPTGCTCDATGAGFPHCGENGWTLDGSITITGTSYRFDVDYAEAGTGKTWHLAGPLALVPAQVGGSLEYDLMWTDGRAVTASAELRTVAVDATHCPSGGVLHADNAQADPTDPSQAFHFAGDLTFTPCATP